MPSTVTYTYDGPQHGQAVLDFRGLLFIMLAGTLTTLLSRTNISTFVILLALFHLCTSLPHLYRRPNCGHYPLFLDLPQIHEPNRTLYRVLNTRMFTRHRQHFLTKSLREDQQTNKGPILASRT